MKSLVARALKDAFGRYIDGLEEANLNLAVWDGDVRMTNLRLRNEFVDDLFPDLPIRLTSGSIDSLHMAIPWTRIGHEPVRLSFRGLRAVGVLEEPLVDVRSRADRRERKRKLEWNAVLEEADFLSRLKSLLSKSVKQDVTTDAKTSSSHSTTTSEGIFSRIGAGLLENLVVEAIDFEVRVSDDGGRFCGRNFTFGVKFNEFIAVACDADGERVTYVETTSAEKHRLIKLSGLSVYWDNAVTDDSHSYVLSECDSTLLLTDRTKAPSPSQSRFGVRVILKGLELNVNRIQYVDWLTLQQVASTKRVVEGRPIPRPTDAPREWWQYAFGLVNAKKKETSWALLVHSVQIRADYISLYKRSKFSSGVHWVKPLSELESKKLSQLEELCEVDKILAFRRDAIGALLAEATVAAPRGNSSGKTSSDAVGSWLKSWMFAGDVTDADGSTTVNEEAVRLTDAERDEILEALDYVTEYGAGDATADDDEMVFLQCVATLENLKLHLHLATDSDYSRVIFQAEMCGRYELKRNVGLGWSQEFSLKKFSAKDKRGKKIVSPRGESDAAGLSVRVVATPALSLPEDYRVDVSVSPMNIYAVPEWTKDLLMFCVAPTELRLGSVAAAALSKYADATEQEVLKALAQRTLVNLKIDLDAPLVALQASEDDDDALFVDLGRLRVVTNDPRLSAPTPAARKSASSACADSWDLRLDQVCVAVSHASDWSLADASLRVLDDFSVGARLSINVAPDALSLNLAHTRLACVVETLRTEVSPLLLPFASRLTDSWGSAMRGSAGEGVALEKEEEEETEPSRRRAFELEILAERLELYVSDSEAKRIASCFLKDFQVDYAASNDGTLRGHVGLSSVEVTSSRNASLVSSRGGGDGAADENLVQIQFTGCGGVVEKVDAALSHLRMVYEPDTVATLREEYLAASSAWASAVVVVDDDFNNTSPPTIKHATISLTSVSVGFLKNDWSILEVILSDSSVEIHSNGVIEGAVGNLKCVSGYGGTLFSVLDDAEALVVFRHAGGESVIDVSPSMLTYSHDFIQELSDYVTEGLMKTLSWRRVGAEPAVRAVVPARAPAPTTFRVSLARPTFFLPGSNLFETINYADGLSLSCDTLVVSNEHTTCVGFLPDDDSVVDCVAVHVRALNVDLYVGVETFYKLGTPLLARKASLVVDVYARAAVSEAERRRIRVAGALDVFDLSLSVDAYHTLHRVLRNNILFDRTVAHAWIASVENPSRFATYKFEEDGLPAAFDATFDFGSASVELVDVDAAKLASFVMSQSSLKLFRGEEEFTTVQLLVDVLDLRDERGSAGTARSLILSKSDRNRRALEVTFVPSTRLIEINVVEFKSVVLLDLFGNIVSFITSTGGNDEEEIVELTMCDNTPIDDDMPWRGNFKLLSPTLYFVSDLHDVDNCECVVVDGDVELGWTSTTTASTWRGSSRAMQARRVQSFTSSCAGVQLIAPANLTFAYAHDRSSNIVHSKTIELSFDQLEVFLSTTDVSLLKRALEVLRSERLLVGLSVAVASASTHKNTYKSTVSEITGILDMEGLVATDVTGVVLESVGDVPVTSLQHAHALMASSKPTTAVTLRKASQDAPLITNRSLDFSGGNAVLNLLDDMEGRDFPIALLSFSRCDIFANGSVEVGTAVGGAQLLVASHFFDVSSGRWESLTSPWELSLTISYKSREVEARVECASPLAINATDAFARAAARTSIDAPCSATINGSHVVENRTGLAMEISHDGAHARADDGESVFVSFAHAPSDAGGMGAVRAYATERVVGVSFPGRPEWGMASVVVSRAYRGRAIAMGNNYLARCDVDARVGRMHLTVGSFVRVRNALKVPIQVLVSNQGWTVRNVELPNAVAPGETMPLPLELGNATEIRVRPLLASPETPAFPPPPPPNEYNWSEAVYASLSKGHKTSHVECTVRRSARATDPSFYVNARVVAEIPSSQESSCESTLFTIHPPVELVNLLPYEIQQVSYMYDKRIAKNTSSSIAPGDIGHVHDLLIQSTKCGIGIDANDATSTIIKLDSELALKFGLKKSSNTSATPLQCTLGDGSKVLCVQVPTPHQGLRLEVYARAWLLNRTGLNLAVCERDDSEFVEVISTHALSIASTLRISGCRGKIKISQPDGAVKQLVLDEGAFGRDLSLSVDVGPGELYKSNMVVIAPRYVIRNACGVGMRVRQFPEDVLGEPLVYAVERDVRLPFWASRKTIRRPYRIQFCTVDENNWSEPVFVDKIASEKRAKILSFGSALEVREGDVPGTLLVELRDAEEVDSTVASAASPFLPNALDSVKIECRLPALSCSMICSGSEDASSTVATLTCVSLGCRTIVKKSAASLEGVIQDVLIVDDSAVVSKFKSVLHRLRKSKGLEESPRPFVSCKASYRFHPTNVVFDRFVVRLCPIVIRADERFAVRAAVFVERCTADVSSKNACVEDVSRAMARGQPHNDDTYAATKTLIYFERLFVAPIDARVTVQQGEYLKLGGLLSRMRVRLDDAQIHCGPLSLEKPFGSLRLYEKMIRGHYESEIRAQLLDLLVSVNFGASDFNLGASINKALFGVSAEAPVDPSSFKPEWLDNAQLMRKYHNIFAAGEKVSNLTQFETTLEHLGVEWNFNHTGLSASRCTIVGFVNKSSSDLVLNTILKSGSGLQCVPKLDSDKANDFALAAAAKSRGGWNPSSARALIAYGRLGFEKIDLEIRSDFFESRFHHTKYILRSTSRGDAAFVSKNVSSWLCGYVVVIEDKV